MIKLNAEAVARLRHGAAVRVTLPLEPDRPTSPGLIRSDGLVLDVDDDDGNPARALIHWDALAEHVGAGQLDVYANPDDIREPS